MGIEKGKYYVAVDEKGFKWVFITKDKYKDGKWELDVLGRGDTYFLNPVERTIIMRAGIRRQLIYIDCVDNLIKPPASFYVVTENEVYVLYECYNTGSLSDNKYRFIYNSRNGVLDFVSQTIKWCCAGQDKIEEIEWAFSFNLAKSEDSVEIGGNYLAITNTGRHYYLETRVDHQTHRLDINYIKEESQYYIIDKINRTKIPVKMFDLKLK